MGDFYFLFYDILHFMNWKLKNKTLFKLCVVLMASSLYAKDGLYLEMGVGMALDDTFGSEGIDYVYDAKANYLAFVGYKYQNWRVDVEYKRVSEELYSASKDGSFSVGIEGKYNKQSTLLNLYYDAYNHTKMISTFGFGCGVTNKEIEGKYKDNSLLKLQGVVGAGYQITPSLVTSVKYSCGYTQSSTHFTSSVDNSVSVTLRYIF